MKHAHTNNTYDFIDHKFSITKYLKAKPSDGGLRPNLHEHRDPLCERFENYWCINGTMPAPKDPRSNRLARKTFFSSSRFLVGTTDFSKSTDETAHFWPFSLFPQVM